MTRLTWVWWTLAAGASAFGQMTAWPVATATYRYVIERTKDSPAGGLVGEATVWPVGLAPASVIPTVTTEDGQPVGAQTLWAAPGQPLKILFDTTGNQPRYHVYLTAQRLAYAPAWNPPEAGCLLEVRDWTGGSMDTVDACRQAWRESKRVQGRGHVPNIFAGANPFGPAENFIALFRGSIHTPVEGDYRFGTTSDDASVLFLNGKVVAEWVGGHGADPHAHRQHSGKVRLPAGTHRLEYLWVQGGGGLTAVAAWQPPGAKDYSVIPPAAFTPVGAFRVVNAEPAPTAPDTVVFEWRPEAHSVERQWALCEYRFRVFNPQPNTSYRWTFDDGRTATGANVTHLFLRPGLRRIKLEAGPAVLTQEIEIHPRWGHSYEWSDETFVRHRTELLRLDADKLPVPDLAEVTRLADALTDAELLTRYGRECLRRAGELTGAHADIFYALGGHFQTPDLRDYATAETALRAGIKRQSDDQRLKLRLARLLLDTFGKLDETGQVLDRVKSDGLNDEQRRLLAILRADLTLARGDVETARRQYAAIGRLGETDRARYSVQRQARLESARAFVARREWEAAENLVRTVEWEAPAERLAPEFGILMAQIHQARREYERAMWRCQRVLTVTANDNLQADVLYQLVDLQRTLGLEQLAERNLAELLRRHPYTEAAARAKDRWGKRKS
jgi:hypothetical protein